jgi:hypothetical protein
MKLYHDLRIQKLCHRISTTILAFEGLGSIYIHSKYRSLIILGFRGILYRFLRLAGQSC